MNIPTQYLVHTVTVRPYAGRTSTGKLYGDPFPLACLAEGKRRMVLSTDGQETLSSLTLICAAGQSDAIPPGSEVDWRGDTTTVIASTNHDDGGLGAPQHTEVVCE